MLFRSVLLHRAQGEGERDEYEARLHEIVSDAAYNSHNTASIRKVLRELMSTTVEWQSPTGGEVETWDACNLLSGAGTTKDKRTGAVTIRWRYDQKVREQLLSPDRYARLSLDGHRTGALVLGGAGAAQQVAGVPGFNLAAGGALPFHRGRHQLAQDLADAGGVVAVVGRIADDLVQPGLVFVARALPLRAVQQHIEQPPPQQADAAPTRHRHQRNRVDVFEQELIVLLCRKQSGLVGHASLYTERETNT